MKPLITALPQVCNRPREPFLTCDPSVLFPGQETLLHLSARLGFTQLSTYLLDQPGSMEALHMTDKEGKVPEEIAREKGMKLLADMFSRYILWFT